MKPILLLALALLSVLPIWGYFASRHQLTHLYANYDGPNYMVIAKCGYNPACIRTHFSLPLPLEYYPAHLPGFPLTIRLFRSVMPGWWAMLFSTLLGTLFMVLVFYHLLHFLNLPQPFWLASLLLFIPARMLVLHTIGAPEPWFIGFLLLAILQFKKRNYLLAGISLAIAQAVKTPAIILFTAFALTIFLQERFHWRQWLKKWPLLLGPAIIIPIFFLYQKQTGDFWAYFHSGDNIHLSWLPFQVFITPHQRWIGTIWLEDIVYIYLLGGLAVLYLLKKYRADIIATFPLLFYIATLLIGHRDISRYSAPLYPFWIIAFAPVLAKKEFKIVFLLLLPAIYLYAIHFIQFNIAPISDWTPYF